MQKSLILLSGLLVAATTHSTDVVLLAKGSEDIVITQDAYPEMRFSEKMLTNTALSMLAMSLDAEQKSIAIPDEDLASAVGQSLFLGDASECKVAIELHFNPEHKPNGEGKGLWIATDKKNFPVAEKILTNFVNAKGVVYRDQPLPLKDLQVEQFDCPTLYVNLDTNVQDGQNLWFIQPQSIMYYTQKIAKSIAKAL